MRSFLIAAILAATIAGAFTLLTAPIAANDSNAQAHPRSDVSQPATKGNRLDLRPVEGCSFA